MMFLFHRQGAPGHQGSKRITSACLTIILPLGDSQIVLKEYVNTSVHIWGIFRNRSPRVNLALSPGRLHFLWCPVLWQPHGLELCFQLHSLGPGPGEAAELPGSPTLASVCTRVAVHFKVHHHHHHHDSRFQQCWMACLARSPWNTSFSLETKVEC